MGGADHRPFGAHFFDAAQQKLAEASGLLDLTEHRFHDLFSQAITAAVSGAFELSPHGLGQRAAGPSLFGGDCGCSWADVPAAVSTKAGVASASAIEIVGSSGDVFIGLSFDKC